MARKSAKTLFVCQSCGYESAKWMGRCTECGAWDTFAEEVLDHAWRSLAAMNCDIQGDRTLLVDADEARDQFPAIQQNIE